MAFPATNVTATKYPLLLSSTRKRKYELFFSGAIQYFLLTPLSHDSLILQKSPSPHVFSKAARRIKKLFSSRLRRRNPVRLNVPSWRKTNSYGFLIQSFVPSIAVIWRERRTRLFSGWKNHRHATSTSIGYPVSLSTCCRQSPSGKQREKERRRGEERSSGFFLGTKNCCC